MGISKSQYSAYCLTADSQALASYQSQCTTPHIAIRVVRKVEFHLEGAGIIDRGHPSHFG